MIATPPNTPSAAHGNAVSQHHLFEQPDQENFDAHGEAHNCQTETIGVAELRQHIAVVNDGPGNQLREKRHEQGLFRQRMGFGFAAVAVHQNGDLLECKKRNSQGQNNVGEREIAIQPRNIGGKKPAYLNQPIVARFAATPSAANHQPVRD